MYHFEFQKNRLWPQVKTKKNNFDSAADYGNLRMVLGGDVTYPVIVQLTNEKGEVQREIIASESQIFEFNNLDPGNYVARVILDKNGNGKLDTGNYLKKIQPEKVSYYPGVIEIRANWEKEERCTSPFSLVSCTITG